MRTMKQRIISVVMAAALCLSLLPADVTALAAAPADKHTVTLSECENGTVSFEGYADSTRSFAEDEEVTVTVEPDEGYAFLRLTLSREDGTVIATDDTAGLSAYAFTMPDTDVLVEAEFCDEADLDYSTQTLGGTVSRTSRVGSVLGEGDISITEDEFYELFDAFMDDSKVQDTDYSQDSRWDCSGMVNYFVWGYLYPYSQGTAIKNLPDTDSYNDYRLKTTIQQFNTWGTVIYDDGTYGKNISSLSNTDPGDLQPGDLIFYGTSKTYVTHVAMYVGKGSTLKELRNNSGYKSSGFYQVENESSQNPYFYPVEGRYGSHNGVRVNRFHLSTSGNTYGSIYDSLIQPYDTSTAADAIMVVRMFEIKDSGYLNVEKSSGDTSITSGNSSYSLENAVYCVYTDEDCTTRAKDVDGNTVKLTTDSSGKSNTVELTEGTYYVKEYSASDGYDLDETVYKAKVTADSTESVPVTVQSEEPPKTAYVTVTKSSANTSLTDGNACYDLSGAEYTLYTNAACAKVATDVNGKNAVLTTKSDGTTGTLEMPLGTYYVKETAGPNAGYRMCSADNPCSNSDGGVHTVTLTSKNTSGSPATVKCADDPLNDPAGITLYKLDSETGEPYAQGDADLSGAQFTVEYYDGYYETEAELPSSPKRTWVIKTKYVDGEYIARLTDDYKVSGDDFYYDEDGVGVVLPLGTYVIYETKAPEGYLIEGTFVDEDGTTVQAGGKFIAVLEHEGDAVWIEGGNVYDGNDDVIRGGVKVQKRDYDTLGTEPQGDAVLSGATFEIVNASADAVMVDGDGDGELEEFAPGAVVLTLTTDENGYVATEADALPYGTYIIRETAAPEGYLNEGDIERTFEIREDGVVVDMTGAGVSINNKVKRGGVEVQKRDVESLRSDPQGNGSFEGITLEITNGSDTFVMVDSDGDGVLEKFQPGEVVLTLTTDGNGYAATGADALPYGRYTVTETAMPGIANHIILEGDPDDGYLLGSADGAAKEANLSIDFTISENGVIVNLTGDTTENGASEADAAEAITDQVKRGDITLTKHDASTQASMGSIPFKITSLTTGESHVIWTDTNGNYDSSRNAHSYRTDAGEDYSDGLWFYGYSDWESFVTYGDDGYMKDNGYVDDYLGALPYDSYRIDELRCDANKDKTLIHDTFTLYDDAVSLSLGEYYNEDAAFIQTEAWASDTGTQVCYVGGDNGDGWVTLYDDVWYYNLTPGQTYGIYGVALDADTREPELDHNGNEIHAWTTFTADKTGNGMEIQEFYFDVEDLSGHRVVFFETIFEVDRDGNILYDDDEDNEYRPYKFYVSEDPDDYERQTIYFPQVGTTLTDEDTGDHFSVTDGTVTLTDHVAVCEVPEGETVVIRGALYDKTTGGALTDENGNGITASGTFVSPGLETWYADLTFTFDASALSGNGTVAYEGLYQLVDGTEVMVGIHADLGDEDQTVYFPAIRTTAVDSETRDHISFADGEATVIDTVEYENLIAGETYTMKGVLMDRETGEALLDDDGNEITSEVTFVAGGDTDGETDGEDVEVSGDAVIAEDAGDGADADDTEDTEDGAAVSGLVNGSVEMVFTFPAGTLAGKAAVAFEELYLGTTLVTEHTDLTDEEQTVWFPEIRTHAYGRDTGEHLAEASDTITIVDAVEYHGLIAGNTYVMTGTLHDKETGEALDVEGATVSVEFTPDEPDGWVYLTFTLDGDGLAGRALVAFEECTLFDVTIATHEDPEDEEQTVWIPAISTTASDAGDGDDRIYAGQASINDRVDYTGLEAGRQYLMVGTLMDKATGGAVTVDGETVTAELSFTPEESDGYVILTVDFDATGMEDGELVMFEKCYLIGDTGGDNDDDNDDVNDNEDDGRIEVAAHEDLEDEAQTVTVMNPSISTTATDAEGGDGKVDAGTITVNDRVDYTDLIAGQQYAMVGTLMSKSTGKSVKTDGEEVTAELLFTPEESDGYVILTVEADATGMEGEALVMFEKCFLVGEDGKYSEVATHEDLDDEAQTVTVRNPAISTTATDAEDGDDKVSAGMVTVNDRVDYTDLIEGRQYAMVGTLMNKSTGEAVLMNGETAMAQVDFTPEESDGYVILTVEADATGLEGEALVMFEKCYLLDDDGMYVQVAAHEDIDDEAQTVTVRNPAISTTATDAEDGDGKVDAGTVTVNDRVDYTDLEAGRQYVLAGTLMNKSTGEAVLVDGKAATAELTFTPEESDGSVTLSVTADATGLEGEALVMFEKCYLLDDDGMYVQVAAHEDIGDRAQTVKVRNRSTGSSATPASGSQTGLRNFGLIAGIIGAVALVLALLLYRRRRMA